MSVKTRGRVGRLFDAGMLLTNRARFYSEAFGFHGVVLAFRDRPASWRLPWETRGPTTRISRPGYGEPFTLRLRGSDLMTFFQVIVHKGYELPWSGPDPRVIVDAGANIGLSSIWFATQYPEAKVIAIEPNRDNFALLEENTAAYP